MKLLKFFWHLILKRIVFVLCLPFILMAWAVLGTIGGLTQGVMDAWKQANKK